MSSHVMPVKTYLLIFGALMVLTVLTVAVAFVDIGFLNTPLALTIAIAKALLVILFFMHVKYSSGLVQIYVASGFVWFVIMVVIAICDYISRGWFHMPQGWQL